MDFPDEVSFAEVPVRYATTKTLLVRNIGQRAANYKISCSAPFSVQPDQGFLPVQGSAQIHVDFSPKETGYYQGRMLVEYDTGEQVAVALSGGADDVDVRLETNKTHLQSTYVTLSTSQTIKIINRSDIMVRTGYSHDDRRLIIRPNLAGNYLRPKMRSVYSAWRTLTTFKPKRRLKRRVFVPRIPRMKLSSR
jgi:hypothetical protein